MIAVLASAALSIAAHPSMAPPRYLVAVGNNDGLPSEARLRYAERDAENFADVMLAYGGVSPKRSRTLLAKTPLQVESVLDAFMADVERSGRDDAILLFYYSGHADERDLHLGNKRWARSRLARKLSKWPGQLRIAVVDACRSRGDIKTKGFRKVPRFAVDRDGPGGLRGGVTLRASSAGEAAQESEQLQGAIYTHYLLTGLRGAADEDRDRRVTLEEAYLYAYQQSVRRSAAGPGTVMHPSVQIELRGAGALVLTETLDRNATLVLPSDRAALYLVYRQPSGRLLAEVRTDAQRATAVAVAPGKYLIQRRPASPDDRIARGGAQQLSVGEGAQIELDADGFTPVPLEVLAAKGGYLQLWGHELALSGGGLVSHAASAGPRVRLRYGVVRGDWAGELSLDLGRFEDQDAFNDRTEQWFGGDVLVTRRRLLGPLQLSVGGAWRVIDQRLVRLDAEALEAAGLSSEERFVGFAVGPTIATSAQWPLSPAWFLRVTTLGSLFFRQEGDAWRARPEASLEVGLGLSL